MFELEESSSDTVENPDTTDELIIDLDENVLADDAIMATQTDEVQSIFNEVGSSSKLKESDTVFLSTPQGCLSARAMKAYTLNSRSKCTVQKEGSGKLEDKPVIHAEESNLSVENAVIFPEDQKQGSVIQVEIDVNKEVAADILQQSEETKLAPKTNRPLSRRPLRKRSPPESDKQLKGEKHLHQERNNMDENISVIDKKEVKARSLKQMKPEPAKLLDDAVLPNPKKRRRKSATATENIKTSEERPKRTKKQPESAISPINHVGNPPKDSKKIMDIKEIMKDMSKLLPAVVLERVTFPRNAAPLRGKRAEQNASSANKTQESLAESSLEQVGNGTRVELGSPKPSEENDLTLDMFLCADKKNNDAMSDDTVIRPAAVASEKSNSISKRKSGVLEDIEDSTSADTPAVILDVSLEISVEGEGNVELQEVKVTGGKRSISGKEIKTSPEIKSLRGRRSAKVLAIEPVIQAKIATPRRRLAARSLVSPNGIRGTSHTISDVVAVKQGIVPKNLRASYEKRNEMPNGSVAGLPDNIGILKENEADGTGIAVIQQQVKIVEKVASNEEINLSTGLKPPKIRRGRGGLAKVATLEPTAEKMKSIAVESSDVEMTNHGLAVQQINMEKSPTIKAKISRITKKAAISSEFRTDLKLYVDMKRVPEVEALAAAMKLEGSKTTTKRPSSHMIVASTSPGVEPSVESGTPGTPKRMRNKKKVF